MRGEGAQGAQPAADHPAPAAAVLQRHLLGDLHDHLADVARRRELPESGPRVAQAVSQRRQRLDGPCMQGHTGTEKALGASVYVQKKEVHRSHRWPACPPGAPWRHPQVRGTRSRWQPGGTPDQAAPAQRAAATRCRACPPPRSGRAWPGKRERPPPCLQQQCKVSYSVSWEIWPLLQCQAGPVTWGGERVEHNAGPPLLCSKGLRILGAP